jgi:competence protein ComFC
MTLPGWLKAEPRGLPGALLGTLFPPRCVACGAAGAWLCPACIAAIPGHGHLSQVRRLAHFEDTLDGVLALSAHVNPLREAVHGLKYEGLRVLADPLSALLASGWLARGCGADLVVPVPLHRSQLRRRGYNQSGLLAAGLAIRTGMEVHQEALVRWRATRSQVGLGHQERLDNVSGEFVCHDDAVRGARIVLVDDVLTTGATMSVCATALCDVGALEVWGLALTHAPVPGP